MTWKQITPEQITGNLFERIGKQWFLLTAGTPEKWNTMTCSWGMGGVMWNRPSVTCYVRQSRHTFGFMQQQDTFTISFFPESERKKLAFCGSHSGRNCDKAKEAGLTPEALGGGVGFAEAELVLVCKKRYTAPMEIKDLPEDVLNSFYSGDAPHQLYIGEILTVYEKQ